MNFIDQWIKIPTQYLFKPIVIHSFGLKIGISKLFQGLYKTI